MTSRFPSAALRRGALIACCALALPATAQAAPGDWSMVDLPGDTRARQLAAGPDDLL